MTEDSMRWASFLRSGSDFDESIREGCESIRRTLPRDAIDLVMVFLSVDHHARAPELPSLIEKELSPKVLLGCTASGIIGGAQEVENDSAISITAAHLPGVALDPFHLTTEDLPSPDDPPSAWHERMGMEEINQGERPLLMLIADPFTSDLNSWLPGLDYAFPRSTKVGGVASGGIRPGSTDLFLNRDIHREGLIGVRLSGNIAMDSVVAQGCRPIGKSMTITASEGNRLLEVDGVPPLAALNDMARSLSPRDRKLAQQSLFVGIVMDPLKEQYSEGDFLLRNIFDADQQQGHLTVGASLRKGQVIQFHIRDATASAENLHALIQDYRNRLDREGLGDPVASALFSCLGRGIGLYGVPHHDSAVFQKYFKNAVTFGFFGNGEIGPVDGTTFLHGYTSSFAMFREAR